MASEVTADTPAIYPVPGEHTTGEELAAHVSADLLQDSPAGEWVDDVLPGCVRRTIRLGDDGEGPVCATVVRLEHEAEPGTSRQAPVLQIHGWTDYFYNLPMARRWAEAGHRFYALDMRKYGRSLRPHQTPGFVEDLREYDAEISAALSLIARENPEAPAPIIHAHSTGGLVAALWAQRHPGRVGALVLNSPWLEVPGDVPARAAVDGLVAPLSHVKPTATVRVPRLENYWESLSAEAHGEWQLHPVWRPRKSFPMTVGWLRAVTSGHKRVHEGLSLDIPVLVLLSSGTVYRRQWTQEYQENDGVLDVELLARRSVRLGSQVTVVRVPKAMHDVFASAEPVRSHAFDQAQRWLSAYAPQA